MIFLTELVDTVSDLFSRDKIVYRIEQVNWENKLSSDEELQDFAHHGWSRMTLIPVFLKGLQQELHFEMICVLSVNFEFWPKITLLAGNNS